MFDRRLMDLCPESRRYIIGNILLQWAELCMNAIMIALCARLIEGAYTGSLAFVDAIPSMIIIAMTIGARFFTARYATRMSYLASKTVKKNLRDLIYEKLLRIGVSYREKVSTAELVQESVEGVDQLESYFGQYVPQFFYAFIAPLTLFVLFGLAGSWSAAAVLMICVPLIPGTIMMVQKIAKKLLARYWGEYTQLGSTFLENLQGMTTLKIYKADAFKNDQMNAESERFRVVTMKVLTMQLNSIIIMDFFTYGGAALGILLAAKSFIDGNIGLGRCVFMILLSADFFLPMRRLGSYFHVAMNGMAASDRIFKFLGLDEPGARIEELSHTDDIRIENVDFAYDAERMVLKGVSLDIPKHSFIGIVGESGSGKSTIASLIMGRRTVMKGRVTVDGKNVSTVNEKKLMQAITYIGHDSYFFKGSVRDNIMPARPNATDADLWRALNECHLDEYLRGEAGLDTELAENASNLSGGQRQRLALARAILHDSDIYIFDEATSNIDMDSENFILQAILDMKKDKTVIMISHRLANVVNADNIYVLRGGEVIESGVHADLIDRNGEYARLWYAQQALEQF